LPRKKKKNKMLHSEMPQSEMLDSLMLAGFRDATCFSLPELTSKEPDCKYASGSLKIGFHQRMSMKFHIWKLSPWHTNPQCQEAAEVAKAMSNTNCTLGGWWSQSPFILSLQTKQQTF
jgi:hypothetical protein